ncbi:SIR2 family NAD-dependent protein deacylase [Paenibacillus xylanexedens]|uniref:SIR2 family NAD-dependent protein deacylase n=1 Tax=Paenibacillus xylanexedens TaxID=528191 RepID=UPI003D0467D0
MNSSNLNIKKIAELLLNKKNRTGTGIVFVLGAGFSMRDKDDPSSKGLGSGWELSKYLGDELCMSELETLQRTSEYYEVVNGKAELIDSVKRYIKSNLVVQDSHRHMARLINEVGELNELIFTVNYDNLLESCYRDEFGTDLEVWKRGEPYNSKKNLYKIHGCISSESQFVLTSEDYYNVKSDENLMKTLYTVFRSHSCVFIGFSMEDQDLIDILFNIRKLNDDNTFLKHYLVIPEEGLNEWRIEYLSKKINIQHIALKSSVFLEELVDEFKKKNKDDQINGYLQDSINNLLGKNKEYPNELVTIQMIERSNLIQYDVERYSYLILFSQFHHKNYWYIFNNISFVQGVELCRYYEQVFMPNRDFKKSITNNIISIFMKGIIEREKEISIEKVDILINLLIETELPIEDSKDAIHRLFDFANDYQKLRMFSLILQHDVIDMEFFESIFFTIYVNKDAEDFEYYITKSIVSCSNKNKLATLSKFFETGFIRDILNLKICILTFDVNNMDLLDSKLFKPELSHFIEQINQEAIIIKDKMASLWTSPLYDGSNSVNSIYPLSEEVSTPEILNKGDYINSRLIIGKEYGCILSADRKLMTINLESGSPKIIDSVNNVNMGPIIATDHVGCATNDEICLYDLKGELLQTEFLIGERVVSMKTDTNEIWGLTNLGNFITLNEKYSFCSEIPSTRKHQYKDFLIFDSYFVFVTEQSLIIFKKLDNQMGDFIEEIDTTDILKVIGINNICYIITSRSISRLDLTKGSNYVVTYDLTDNIKSKPIVVESVNTLIFASNERMLRVIFNDSAAFHRVVYQGESDESIEELISCNGLLAMITKNNKFVILKSFGEQFKATTEINLDYNSEGYNLSCGYGALYITSNDVIYVIKNREAVINDEHVA